MSGFIQKHGLTGNTKRLVFDALFVRQQGKCFICGISQEEIEAKWQAVCEERRRYAETIPGDHPDRQRLLKWYTRGLMPVHRKLQIDHCHQSGHIRGLLCWQCNTRVGGLEQYAFREKPEDMSEKDFARKCEYVGRWIEEHREVIFLYMQRERWLPQKDIVFHLQAENRKVDELAALDGFVSLHLH